MKTIILAGGLGTRISEETVDKPKPMVLIDGKPLLWHLMTIFSSQGFNEFVIATGYMKKSIEEWVENLEEKWEITTVDTGQKTQTGGRIAKCLSLIGEERAFATYGDGLGNVNLRDLLSFHIQHRKWATVTAVRPPARFGVLESTNGLVTHFAEKNQTDAGWINGGFFVLEPQVRQFVTGENEPFESGALSKLVVEKNLMAFHHHGFWQPMDTLREKMDLERFATQNPVPWLDLET